MLFVDGVTSWCRVRAERSFSMVGFTQPHGSVGDQRGLSEKGALNYFQSSICWQEGANNKKERKN